MRKKFTMLLASLLLTMGVWAQPETGKEYRIKDDNSGKYLTIRSYGGNSSGAYGTVPLLDKTVSPDQVWVLEDATDGTYYLKSRSGYYLKCRSWNVDATSGDKSAVSIVAPDEAYLTDLTLPGYNEGTSFCIKNGEYYFKSQTVSSDGGTWHPFCDARSDKDGWADRTTWTFEEVGLEIELTTDSDNPVYYTIKNMRGAAYAEYDGAGNAMLLEPSVKSVANLFYFTEGTVEGTYKIHNAVTDKMCAATNSWSDEGRDWYIVRSGNTEYVGYAIATQETLTDGGDTNEAWNDYENNHTSIAMYGGDDAGSVWTIDKYTAESPTIKMSTESEKHLYFIMNDRTGKYANYVAAGTQFTQVGSTGYGSYWYFVDATADLPEGTEVPEGTIACRIYNAANELAVENPESGNMSQNSGVVYPAKIYYLRMHENNHWGYGIYPYDETAAGWNDAGNNGVVVGCYTYDDPGSIWSMIEADRTEAQLKAEATNFKNNALDFISLAEEADYYTYADEAIATARAAVEGVATNTLHGAVSELMNPTIEPTLATLKATDRGTAGPTAGTYIQLKNRQNNNTRYLKANESDAQKSADSKDLATLWYVEAGTDSNVKLKNVATGKYLGQTRMSTNVPMVESAEAKEFAFTNQEDFYAVFKDISGGDYAYGHSNGNGAMLVGWLPDAEPTQWVISQGPEVMPEEGQYYLIECPLFYDKQGVQKALYSDGTNPGWKTLDDGDKSFYWTVEKTENGYVLKNCNDDKYILGKANDNTSWTMETEATGAEYTIEVAGEGQVFIKIAGRHLHANNHSEGAGTGSNIVSWETNLANSPSAWKFIAVDGNPDMVIARNQLAEAISTAMVLIDSSCDLPGFYRTEENLSDLATRVEEIIDFKGNITESTPVADIEAKTTEVNGIIATFSVNLPEAGKFYRIKNNGETGYLSGDHATSGRTHFVDGIENSASSIFYFDGTKLLAYTTGLYLAKGTAEAMVHYTQTVGESAGTTFAFSASPVLGKLLITFDNGSRSFYSAGLGQTDAAGSGQTGDNYRFTVEEVTTLPVTVTAAGWGTFYTPVAVTVPNTVTAYTITAVGEKATLTPVTGIVPAGTGLILEGEGTHNFDIATEDAVGFEKGLLQGSTAKTYVTAEANTTYYVLAKPEGAADAGLYKAKLDKNEGTAFLNGANKVYLPVEETPATPAPAMFAFTRGDEEGDSTGIESVELGGELVIYDLAGRRVAKMEKGIYIVNGKKVVIK